MKVTFKRGRGRSPLEIIESVRRVPAEEAARVKGLYDGVVDNWNTAVEFSAQDISSGEDLRYNVYARGENADIFKFVDYGTDKRYAVMRDTFSPRTRRGSLHSAAAGGNRRVSYFDYDEARAAQRAIEARKFGETIIEERRDAFSAAMKAALKR